MRESLIDLYQIFDAKTNGYYGFHITMFDVFNHPGIVPIFPRIIPVSAPTVLKFYFL